MALTAPNYTQEDVTNAQAVAQAYGYTPDFFNDPRIFEVAFALRGGGNGGTVDNNYFQAMLINVYNNGYQGVIQFILPQYQPGYITPPQPLSSTGGTEGSGSVIIDVSGVQDVINNLAAQQASSLQQLSNSVGYAQSTLATDINGFSNQAAQLEQASLHNLDTSQQAAINNIQSAVSQLQNQALTQISQANFQATQAEQAQLHNYDQEQQQQLQLVSQSIQSAQTQALQNFQNAQTTAINSFGNISQVLAQQQQRFEATLNNQIVSANTTNQQTIEKLTGTIGEQVQVQTSINSKLTDIANSIASNGPTNILNQIIVTITQYLDLFTKAWNTGIAQGEQNLSNIWQTMANNVSDRDSHVTLVLNNLLNGKYTSIDQLYTDIDDKQVATQLITLIQNTWTILSSVMAIFQSKNDIVNEALRQLNLSQYNITLPDLRTVIEAWIRREITDKQRDDYLHKMGYSDDVVNLYLQNSNLKLSPDDYRSLLWRGKLDADAQRAYLRFNSYDDTTIDLMQVFNTQLLGPQDLIRLGDKHIYSQDIQPIFGQYTELDNGLVEALSQWGYSKDDIAKLWAGHWSLPSPQQIFEMFQRGFIDDNALSTYLKLTDYLPFFRDKLKSIAYQPITRVDIRRLHQEGLVNSQQLVQLYQNIGYSPQDAKLLADFTIKKDNLSETTQGTKIRELSLALVEKAYTNGLMNYETAIARMEILGYRQTDAQLILDLIGTNHEVNKATHNTDKYKERIYNVIIKEYTNRTLSSNEAISELTHLGYSQDTIEADLGFADYEHSSELHSSIIKYYEQMYVSGAITEAQLSAELGQRGFSGSAIQQIIDDFSLIVTFKIKKPSEAQLQKFLKDGIITEQIFTQEMSGLGYAQKYINWFLTEITGVVH